MIGSSPCTNSCDASDARTTVLSGRPIWQSNSRLPFVLQPPMPAYVLDCPRDHPALAHAGTSQRMPGYGMFDCTLRQTMQRRDDPSLHLLAPRLRAHPECWAPPPDFLSLEPLPPFSCLLVSPGMLSSLSGRRRRRPVSAMIVLCLNGCGMAPGQAVADGDSGRRKYKSLCIRFLMESITSCTTASV